MGISGRGTCHMSFKVGDTVVYPHMGLLESRKSKPV
jgi:hypothetical protein